MAPAQRLARRVAAPGPARYRPRTREARTAEGTLTASHKGGQRIPLSRSTIATCRTPSHADAADPTACEHYVAMLTLTVTGRGLYPPAGGRRSPRPKKHPFSVGGQRFGQLGVASVGRRYWHWGFGVAGVPPSDGRGIDVFKPQCEQRWPEQDPAESV